jgi:hypothetical protein
LSLPCSHASQQFVGGLFPVFFASLPNQVHPDTKFGKEEVVGKVDMFFLDIRAHGPLKLSSDDLSRKTQIVDTIKSGSKETSILLYCKMSYVK